ncbi:hypothetical protein PTTG_02969 [Puccinia triticina 1-1 BBBD Race 1]|uniref:Uncharacterized protein n=2 Tax=Puccinia triticina TaxID=208348 RepID=A0A180GM96_PUCT1|nr:uncharacterized protein PtA15_12A517 [Puccinia triticina]OAV93634.1 hypothetical protein PTTG_02969 [Puccinia triticina 1-1 BBBD Race 1]WAQ90527.1 hypothetical protein PtA15_12A517 [Puccinia triticina]
MHPNARPTDNSQLYLDNPDGSWPVADPDLDYSRTPTGRQYQINLEPPYPAEVTCSTLCPGLPLTAFPNEDIFSSSHTDDQDEEQANSEDELREDVIMEEKPDERSSRDVYWVQRESDRRHSRSSSASSQAISPSSTVFADHHRGHSSRTAARSNGSEDQHSNVHRSSLISLQLRPEDELFLENYLEEDGDGIDTDIDY